MYKNFIIMLLLIHISLYAVTQTFTDYATWLQAVGTSVTTLNFEGIANGTSVNDPSISSIFTNAGVSFRQHSNGTFPRIYQGGTSVASSGVNILSNLNCGGFDEFANGIVWDFTVPVYAVGWFKNPGDSNAYRIYNTEGILISSLELPKPGILFGGFISDQRIAFATSINTPPEDGLFGIDDIQFATMPVPEPYSIAMILVGLMLMMRKIFSQSAA